jgi:hypothetical protein
MLWNRNEYETNKVMGISRQQSPIQILTDQKQPENVEYTKYIGSIITKDARCTREIKSRKTMAIAAFKQNNNNIFFANDWHYCVRNKLKSVIFETLVCLVPKVGHF